MITKSLYIRTIITFISVVIISILTSYSITSLFVNEEVIFDEEVTKIATGVAQLIEITEPESIPELIETLGEFNFDLMLVNEDGVTYSPTDFSFTVDQETQETFLNSERPPAILPYIKKEATRTVGIPIEISNEQHAMFIHMNYEEEVNGFRKIIVGTLFLVLFIGSLLFLFASRYFVNPIKKLTNAAKEMATGNLSVRLKSKNKDEIGELITSFNYMASELEKIDKMRDDFVSNVSHEIQSPLTSIKGFTKAIRDEVVPVKNQKEYLDIIYQETDRLSRLSENLLQLASLDSEYHPFHPVTFKLDEQIRRSVLTTEPLWKKKDIQIHLDLGRKEVTGDEDLFEQVWVNLLTNAIKYSSQHSIITISMTEKESETKVSITDKGKGIPKEEIPYLFDRFYKVDKARTSVEGNGLGLAIVKRILSINHCSIDVESKEGRGSTFTVTIPTSG
ncbi:sensor histidine kinase [Salipaludibacillus sp. CF4.18]|uniref:sensor histidine kinase n=1 Tax=Salipaludibacillus sp. CF4.18 TaxID=3373081 RepID=UPI003EE688FB